MAWKISKAKRQALVKLQLRDKKGRWIEMGGGVKWYSSRLKKQVSGTVVGTKGENALVRLDKQEGQDTSPLVSVAARSITVIDDKATLAPTTMGTPTDKTSSFEKPIAVANETNGAPKSNGYVKPSDSPEDYAVTETADGRAYIGRADGAELYFPARSLEVGDVLLAPNGGDETKPFSIGKGWAKKGVESVNSEGPKTGTVLRIEGDRYAVVQLPDGFTVPDKKHEGEQTDLVTVGLSNSVIKLTDGMQTALGDHINATFDGNGEDQEIDDSEEEQSDHVGREVPEEEVAAEENPADVNLTDITDGEEEEKSAPITEQAREIDVPQADNSGSDDQSLNENGLTDDEQKLVKAYDRMAQRAYDQGNVENGATYEANANRLRKLGEDRRAGAKADEANPTDTPVKDPQNAPQAEKAPEPAPEQESASEASPEAAKANVSLDDLEKQAEADGDTVLYHGGLPDGTTLDDIDLNRNGSQQNKRGRSFGGFYLTDESSKKWSEDYAEKRNGVMHGFALDKNARIDDRGSQQIDRLSAEDRAEAAKNFDVIMGKDLLGRTQYVLLNKDAIKGVGETNIKDDKSSKDSAPESSPEAAPEAPEVTPAPKLEEPDKKNPVDAATFKRGMVVTLKKTGQKRFVEVATKYDGKPERVNARNLKDGKPFGKSFTLPADDYYLPGEEPDALDTAKPSPDTAEAPAAPKLVEPNAPATNEPKNPEHDVEPEEGWGHGKKTKLSFNLKGSTLSDMQNAIETAESSLVDPGIRMNGNKAEIYDLDKAKWTLNGTLGLYNDNLKYPEEYPAAERASMKRVVAQFDKIIGRIDELKAETDDDRFLNGYNINDDSQLGKVKKNSYEDDYVVQSTSDALIQALPVGSSIATVDQDRADAGYEIVKVAPDVWAHPKRYEPTGWTILSDSDMVEYDVEQGIKLPGNPKLEPLSQRELDQIEVSRKHHEEDRARVRQGLEEGARELREQQSAQESENAPEPVEEPEAAPEAAPEAPEAPVEAPEDAPEGFTPTGDQPYPNLGMDEPTLFKQTLRGNTRNELEMLDESARESEYDQGYRIIDGKFEVYDFDRALSSLEDNLEPWTMRLETYPTRENPNAGGYNGGVPKAKTTSIVNGIHKLQEAVRAAKAENDGRQKSESSEQDATTEAVNVPDAPTEATDEPKTSIDDWKDSLQRITDALDDPELEAAGNRITAGIQKLNGLDGPPTVINSREEFDALPGKKLFRGVGSQEDAEKFMTGPNWVGAGGSGSGIYTSTNKFRGESFKRADGGALTEMKLSENAKIANGKELEAERVRDLEKAIEDNDPVGQFLSDGDIGKYAAARGLDGYSVEPIDPFEDGEEFIVLTNRAAVSVFADPIADANDVVDAPESAPEVSTPDAPDSSPTEDGEPDAAVVSHLNENAVLGDNAERHAAGLYLGGARYNAALREGKVPEMLQEQIDALTGFIDKQPEFGQETKLYRGMAGGYLPENAVPGETITEPAFMSTSLKRSEAEIFAGTGGSGVIMEITARPEDRALSVNAARMEDQSSIPEEYRKSLDVTEHEAEMLLRPNTALRIDSVEEQEINGQTYKVVQAGIVDAPEAPERSAEESAELDENGLTPEEARQLEIAREEDYLGGIADKDPESREYYQKPIDDLLEKGRQRLNPTPEEQAKLDELDKAMDDAVASDDIEAYDAASDAKTDLEEEISARPEEESSPEPEETVSESEESAPEPEESASDTDEESSEPEVHPLDALGIKRRTPEAVAGESYAPTQQQQDVIDAVLGGLDTKVQAMAGTGKTSTLVALSRRIAEQGGQAVYIAFNKTVQEEAVRRMEGLPVEPKTGHAVAHTWATKNMPHLTVRLGGNDPTRVTAKYANGKPKAYAKKKAWTGTNAVAGALGINAGDVKEESGIPKSKSNIVLAVKKTVEKFALSDSDTIQTSHVPEVFEIAESDLPKIVDFANDYWDDLKREDGNFRVTHDVYRKFWALSKPDLTDGTGGTKKGANILYIDEAQDTPPVLAKVVADQKMQKVIVGDANQAIYAFAENIDYLSEADGDIELPLNKSWRFGPEVADAGNRFLQMLGSENRVVGGGGPSKVTYDMEDADAVLVRTNAGMIHAVLEETKRDRRVTAPAGTRSNLESLVESVEALKAGYEPEHPHDDLIGYKNWDQVKGAWNAGDNSLNMIVKLFDVVDNYSLSRLKPEQIEEEVARKMADAKKAIDHLVIDVPGHNTIKMVQRDGRTYLEPVDENPYPVDEKGKQKPWGWKEKQYAVSNFSAKLGETRKPWLKDNNLDFGPQQMEYRKKGGLEDVGWTYERGEYFTDDEAAIKRFNTYGGQYDVTVSTAHKSKGLEWDRVRIGWDFIGPREDAKTGEMIWPEDDEYKLGYVALTRAAKEIDPGSLDYVFQYTQPNGGDPKAGKGNVTVPEDTTPEPEQVADEPPVDVTPDTEKEADDALVFADPEFTPAPETRETPEATPEPEAEEAPEEVAPEVAPEEAPVYDDLTGLTAEEESYKDSLIEQAKLMARSKRWADHKRLVKEYNAMFDKGRERLKLQKQQNAAEEVAPAPEPEVSPEPTVNPAPGIVPEPMYDEDGLTPEEAARVANLEKWINDVYKGYGQGNVKKMENELDDLYKRGEKRQNGEPDAEAPIDTTPEFETPAPVSLNPEVEPEAPSPVDGVPVVKPMKKSVPTGRRRGQSTVPDADGGEIKVGDTIKHKKFGDVVVTGVLPGAGRVTFMHPKTGKESSVKGDAVSLSKGTPPTVAEAVGATVTGTPGDRLMDPITGKKAFIGSEGRMIVTGDRVRDNKTGQIGIVQTVYTGADKKASVPILFPGEAEPRRVRGTQLSHAENGGGSETPELPTPAPEAPEPTPEAPKAPEAPEPAPEAPSATEPAPVPAVDDEKTARRRAAIGNAPSGAEVHSKDGGEIYIKYTDDVWGNFDATESLTDDEVLDKILNGEADGKGYTIRTPRPEVAPEPAPEPEPTPEPEPEVIPEPDTSLSGQALADTITYESTLHMTDGDLADMMVRYADDPIVFDKIMEVIDERDANPFLEVDTSRSGADLGDQPALFDVPEPVAKEAAKRDRKPTPQQKASEEYQNYVMAQYFRAAEELNGVLLNEAGKAHFNKDLAVDIFSGPVSVAHKYASEELLQWWRENGRETLASFRFGMYGWEQDRKAAQTARNLGYQRGSRDRDRSNF